MNCHYCHQPIQQRPHEYRIIAIDITQKPPANLYAHTACIRFQPQPQPQPQSQPQPQPLPFLEAA